MSLEARQTIAKWIALYCGFDSTGNSLAWALGSSVGVSKMLSLKNFFSGAEILLNGNDGAVQLKTGAVNGAKAQALTINKDEVKSYR